MIGRGESRVAGRVQQLRGVRVIALNSKQNVESRDASGRDRHSVLGSQTSITTPVFRRFEDDSHERSPLLPCASCLPVVPRTVPRPCLLRILRIGNYSRPKALRAGVSFATQPLAKREGSCREKL